MLEGSRSSLGARLDLEPATQETGRKSHQAVEWTLTKVTRCESDEDVNRTYGKKENSIVGTRSFFLPLQNEGEWRGEGEQCLGAKSKE